MSFVNGIVYLDLTDDFNNYFVISVHAASINYGMKVTWYMKPSELGKEVSVDLASQPPPQILLLWQFCCHENNSRKRAHQGLKKTDNSDPQQNLRWETEVQTVCDKVVGNKKEGAKHIHSCDSLKMALLGWHNAGNNKLVMWKMLFHSLAFWLLSVAICH